MKIRTRLFLALLLAIGICFIWLTQWLMDGLRPRYLATVEESLVDISQLLAANMEVGPDGVIRTEQLQAMFEKLKTRTFKANVYELQKESVDLSVHVVSRQGLVIFDSTEVDIGQDFSNWNDVARTLRGEYGARSTRRDKDDPRSTTLYISAPIWKQDEIVGVLTVGKPITNVNIFLDTAKRKMVYGGIYAGVVTALLAIFVSFMITRPLDRLRTYALRVRDGNHPPLPPLGTSEISELGQAFDDMRNALEDRQYVENYVQTLTHEMKSPLSAIRGASELLEEEMPTEDRERFIKNIRSETGRIEQLIDRMLQLASVEQRLKLEDVEKIQLAALFDEVLASLNPLLRAKNLSIVVDAGGHLVNGEGFLLRQALTNLVHNAIEFSRKDGVVRLTVSSAEDDVLIEVADKGSGIPAYALDKVFDRFYSLQRPDSEKKSSGLGLSFVREVAQLHNGSVTLTNGPDGGAVAILTLSKK